MSIPDDTQLLALIEAKYAGRQFYPEDIAGEYGAVVRTARLALNRLVKAGHLRRKGTRAFHYGPAPATAIAQPTPEPATVTTADLALSLRIQELEEQKAGLTEQVRRYREQAGQLQRRLDLTDQMLTETRMLAADREHELEVQLQADACLQAESIAELNSRLAAAEAEREKAVSLVTGYECERDEALDEAETARRERDTAYAVLEQLLNGASLALLLPGRPDTPLKAGQIRLPSGKVVAARVPPVPVVRAKEVATAQPAPAKAATNPKSTSRPRRERATPSKPIRPQKAESLADLDEPVLPERAPAAVREEDRLVPLKDLKTVSPEEEVKAAIVRALREQGRPMSESMLRNRLICPRKLLGAGVFEASCKALMAAGELKREGKGTGRYYLPEQESGAA